MNSQITRRFRLREMSSRLTAKGSPERLPLAQASSTSLESALRWPGDLLARHLYEPFLPYLVSYLIRRVHTGQWRARRDTVCSIALNPLTC